LNQITEVTRLRIFDGLARDGALWFGRLDDLKFLRRLYDLQALPSHDTRFRTAEQDIIQHRFNNPEDWEDDWIFDDPRFGLAEGTDEVLLAFLTEMLHPAVRPGPADVDRLLSLFNTALIHDGYQVVQRGQISGAPVFSWQQEGADQHTSEDDEAEAAADRDTGEVVVDVSADADVLIARYGQAASADEHDRLDAVVAILRDHLASAGWHVRDVRSALLNESRAFGLERGGDAYVVDALWPNDPAGREALEDIARAAEDHGSRLPRIVMCLAGYSSAVTEMATARTSGGCILLDAGHLEAMLCWLLSAHEIFDEALRELRFDGKPFVSLTDLLARGAPPPARMHTPDKRPAPWPMAHTLAPGVEAVVALVAEPGWEQPTGMSQGLPGHVLVTVNAGVLDLDIRRGTTSWLVHTPGCHGPALLMPDDRLLVMCRQAVLEVSDAGMRAVGGGFDTLASLVPADNGEVWVLSGAHRVSNYGDEVSLALTRLGTGPGDQHRRTIKFEAAVRSAVCLGGHRFFLAATGHSAVIDLDRSSLVTQDEWIPSSQPYPGHGLRDGAGRILSASRLGSGVHAVLHRTEPATGASELLADLALNGVDGLAADSQGSAYLLGDVRGNDLEPKPILIRLAITDAANGAVDGDAAIAPAVRPIEPAVDLLEKYDPVLTVASGQRRDYALSPRPVDGGDSGGQGTVYPATHKASGMQVAFKKVRSKLPDSIARMRREIEIGQLFAASPFVMPVLDGDPNAEWMVMPLAADTAETLAAELQDPAALRSLVNAACGALRLAHAQGWIHRDIKPANILKLDGRWVLADWGLGRRPRGQTTNPNRTRVGTDFGTEGFAAPELADDAHQADGRADIYSLGQVIGWALTRTMPKANIPLLPPDGPWRRIVKEATRPDQAQRPADIDALLRLIQLELDPAPEIPANTAERLLADIKAGRHEALEELLDIAVRNPDDYEIYVRILPDVDVQQCSAALVADPHRGREVMSALSSQEAVSPTVMEYGEVDRVMWLMWEAAQAAAGVGEWDLFEVAVCGLLEWDSSWDRWNMCDRIHPWVSGLAGEAASTVASVLRRLSNVVEHYSHLADDRRTDHRIRASLTIPGGHRTDKNDGG